MNEKELGEIPFSKDEFIDINAKLDATAMGALYIFIKETSPIAVSTRKSISYDSMSTTDTLDAPFKSIVAGVYNPYDEDEDGNELEEVEGFAYSYEFTTSQDESFYVEVEHTGVVSVESIEGDDDNSQTYSAINELPLVASSLRKERVKNDLRDEVYQYEFKQKRLIVEAQLDDAIFGNLESVKGIEVESLLPDLSSSTLESIAKIGFEPRFHQLVGEKTNVYLSGPVSTYEDEDHDSSRLHILAYIETNEGWKARLYYTSTSQACWRLMPNYSASDGHFGKGKGEHSLTLVPQLQKTFNEVARDKEMNVESDVFTKEILTNSELIDQIKPESSSDYDYLTGNPHLENYGSSFFDLSNPGEHTPNFSEKLEAYEPIESKLYGTVYQELFESNDQRYLYLMAHSSNGMAWVQNVSFKDVKIRQDGLIADEFVEMRGIAKPAFEYIRANSELRTQPLSPVYKQYANNFLDLANKTIIKEYYKTIPRDHLEFMNTIPSDINPSVELYLLRKPVGYDSIYDDEYEVSEDEVIYRLVDNLRDEEGVREVIRKATTILGDLKSYSEFTDQPSQLQDSLSGTAPLPILDYGETEIDWRMKYNSGVTQRAIRELGLELVDSNSEKYDDRIVYESYQLPGVSGSRLSIVRKDGVIIEDGVHRTLITES